LNSKRIWEAIFSLNTLVQNCLDQGKNVFICFIYYEKAFDNVKHDLLIKFLQDLDLDDKDIRLIANLYWHHRRVCNKEGSQTGLYIITNTIQPISGKGLHPSRLISDTQIIPQFWQTMLLTSRLLCTLWTKQALKETKNTNKYILSR